jgi:hypothetical protein
MLLCMGYLLAFLILCTSSIHSNLTWTQQPIVEYFARLVQLRQNNQHLEEFAFHPWLVVLDTGLEMSITFYHGRTMIRIYPIHTRLSTLAIAKRKPKVWYPCHSFSAYFLVVFDLTQQWRRLMVRSKQPIEKADTRVRERCISKMSISRILRMTALSASGSLMFAMLSYSSAMVTALAIHYVYDEWKPH